MVRAHMIAPPSTYLRVLRVACMCVCVCARPLRSRSVKPSSKVTQFDPLCEVQSDKASVEITSPFDGVVKELLVQEGEVAKVGSGLCMIEVEEEEGAAQEPTASAAEPATTALASALSVGTESGPRSPLETTTAAPAPARRHHPLDPSAPPSASVSTQCAPAPSRQRANGKQADVLAAPSVRYYARQQGIDLAQLAPGSGRDGRVEKKDVDSYLSGASAGADAGAGAGAGAQAPKSPAAQEVELGRTRYEMWKAMEKVCVVCGFLWVTFDERIADGSACFLGWKIELGDSSFWVGLTLSSTNPISH